MIRQFVPMPLVVLLSVGWCGLSVAQAADHVPAVYEEEGESTSIGPLEAIEEAAGDPRETVSDADQAAVDDQQSEESAAEPSTSGPEIEIIRERYPNRAVKIEREVTQDASGNYVNHGAWRMWDQKGTLVVDGHFRNGEREGVWNRWYRSGEVELLTKPPYNGFQGPFISQATFTDGKLDGKWTIYDGKQHRISEWEFADGDRHGRSTWFYPSGRKMRETDYNKGEIDGQLLEWNADAKLVVKDTYQQGRKLAPRTEKHAAGATKSEGLYLFAKEIVQTPDDWWNAKTAVYIKTGKDEKHGPWVAWYPNGQKQAEGEYRNDVQVGKFVWWYENGQKALEGAYGDGEQEGRWVWWHDNGQKSIQGEYTKGHPSGRWTWWQNDGKVVRSTQMEQGAGEVVHVPEKPQPQPRSSARPETLPPQPHYRAVR
jgi:uncharacterized protein